MPNDKKNKQKSSEQQQPVAPMPPEFFQAYAPSQTTNVAPVSQADMLPDQMQYSQPYDPITGQLTQGPGYTGMFRGQPPVYMIPGSPIAITQPTMQAQPWNNPTTGQDWTYGYQMAGQLFNEPWMAAAMRQQGMPQPTTTSPTPGMEYPAGNPLDQYNYAENRMANTLPQGLWTQMRGPNGQVYEYNKTLEWSGPHFYPSIPPSYIQAARAEYAPVKNKK